MRCMRFLDSAFCSSDNLSISSENLEFQSVIATFRAVLVAPVSPFTQLPAYNIGPEDAGSVQRE